MKNTYPKEISVNRQPAKTVVPPDMAAPIPAMVAVEHLGEFLHLRGYRVIRFYWTTRKEFVAEVVQERKDEVKDESA